MRMRAPPGDRPRDPNRRPESDRRAKRRGNVRFRRVFEIAAIGVGLSAAAVLLLVATLYAGGRDVDDLMVLDTRPAVVLVDAQGRVLDRRGRMPGRQVTVEALPPHLVQAVLATEDRRFYSHFGIDPIGIGRATLSNIRAGTVVQGGSTITQQLAKILFLTPERSFWRKLREAVLALRIERTHDKDEILAAYLNQVYLGDGAYGVDAAARHYFGKPATALDLTEAATIAGLIKAPSRVAPSRAPERAAARATTVLHGMVAAGYIDAETARAARPTADSYRLAGEAANGRHGMGWFTDWVVRQVARLVPHEQGDLIIQTTIQLPVQKEAARSLVAGLADEPDLEGAAVVMDPDGAVRAMVGGRDYRRSQFNRAVDARRQPGSAFKPFVYLAALEAGLSPQTVIEDVPIDVDGWRPTNFDGLFRGRITMRRALMDSINVPTVRLAQWIGTDRIVETARRLGLDDLPPPHPSLSLGTGLVGLSDLTGAYATLAGRGQVADPYGIVEVRTLDERVVYRHRPRPGNRVIAPDVVAQLAGMLADAIRDGTGHAARVSRDAAGKTGTSQDNRDAWFVGFTAQKVAGVWIGRDDNGPTDGITGGGLPARLWAQMMTAAHEGLPPVRLPTTTPSPVAGGVSSGIEQTGLVADTRFDRGDIYEAGTRSDGGLFDRLLGVFGL